jgi:[protein-PII] uridylyltransferase
MNAPVQTIPTMFSQVVMKRRFRRGSPDHGTRPASAQLGPDMVEIDGEIALTPLAPVSDDASLGLRLAATAARLDRPIARGSLHRLADRMPPPGDPWTDETREELVTLLGLGRPAIDKIE